MAPVIGRRWRPICGFAEPYASVRGRDPGNPAGESSPFLTSTPEGGAVRLCGIQAVAVGTICRVHLRLRRLPPVNVLAEPSERAQRRTPESTPIRSLLSVKAATLRQASKSPIHTASAGRPDRK